MTKKREEKLHLKQISSIENDKATILLLQIYDPIRFYLSIASNFLPKELLTVSNEVENSVYFVNFLKQT